MPTPTDLVDDVAIREPRDGDRFAVGVPAVRPDEDIPRWRRSRVAIADEEVVGAATFTLSAVTDSYFCEVTVAPGYRRRGVGTRLYAAAYSLLDRPFPVLARAMSSQPIRRRFAESIGCSEHIHCPEPWIDPASAPAQQWIAQQRLPSGYTVAAMRDLPAERVEGAWATYFAWVHRPFGTVHVDRLPQLWAGYREGVDPEVSMLAVRTSTGDIVALSLVTPDAWDGRTMVVSETVQPDQPDGDQLLRATVAASLTPLGRRGTHRVELEGHTTDPHSPQLVRSLPPGGGDPMVILRLAPPR
jgi:GNAT superfamily N-acetyltransferase